MKLVDDCVHTIRTGNAISRASACALASLSSEEEITYLMNAANTIRKTFTTNEVDFCSLINAKSGACSENCSFCAQSGHYNVRVAVHAIVDPEVVLQKAQQAERFGAKHFCIVTSGAQLTDKEFDTVLISYKKIRKATTLEIDGSLGFLTKERVQKLVDVGLSRYNHNLETSRRFFPHICTTHTFDDRLKTIRLLKQYGISVCSGGIIGMGEDWDDRIDLAYTLRDELVMCIPINILNPRPGTPLENSVALTPLEILHTVALFRFINPTATIKIAGGREQALGDEQQTALESGGNGFIIGGYLTTIGNEPEEDIAMAQKAGFAVPRISSLCSKTKRSS